MRRLMPSFFPGVRGLAAAIVLGIGLGACQQVPSSHVPAKAPEIATPAPLPEAASPPPVQPPPPPLMPPPSARSGTAAVLVPLSGPQGALGAALLNAAQLALFELGDPAFALLAFDTKGTAEGAAQAAQAAIAQGAEIIVGPLLSSEVKAAAFHSRAANIPLVGFTTDRTAAGAGVYVLGFLPGPQADRVLAQAQAAGLKRVAVLAPGNDYGRRLVEYLAEQAGLGGSAIVAQGFYDPAAQDWAMAANNLVKANPANPADIGFDALLLADDGQRLRSIAASLHLQGIDPAKIKLLGTMLWLESRPGSEPALVGGWYAAPPAADHADFDRRYQKAFGGKAPRLASLAYDATALTLVLAKARPHDYSPATLTNPIGFAGVDGIFRLRPDGLAERGYAVWEVQAGGQDRQVAPPPAGFQAAY